MNKYLVCHSHISVEPEAVCVDKVLSFTEMESVLNEDCVLIVSDIVHASLTASYVNHVQKNPSCVYGVSGLWADITDGNIQNCTAVVKFDRSFAGQRYTTLDYGDQPVHVFTLESYAFNPSKIKIKPSSNCYVFSSELEKAGIPRVVVDTKLWMGPRINMPRFTTFNFKAALFIPLASTEWKALPRPEDKEEEDESEGIMPEPLEQKEYSFDGLPDVMVMITTHNRTDTALATIESLVKHLKYPKLKWCICDDRSEEGHVAKIADKFFELGVEDVKICRTNDERWGLGASMNNGLRACFDVGPVAFTTEDDWLLTKDLDITKWVNVLLNDTSTGVVRLAALWHNTTRSEKYDDQLDKVVIEIKNNNAAWVLTNQVALRHRRVYDSIGLYKENCSPDDSEGEMKVRFNRLAYYKYFVLWPHDFKTGTMNDKSLPFCHFGKSVVGHDWSRFDVPVVINKVGEKPFFRIITPAYNASKQIQRCLDSLEKQSFKNFVWVVVDDASIDDTPEKIKNIASTRPWIIYRNLPKHVDAGGARNVALSISESEYTLYLDSDDEVVGSSTLESIYNFIIKNGRPDVIKLGYVDNDNIYNPQDIHDVPALLKTTPGPPMNCHKSSLSPKFIPFRRRFNDVVWFLRLCDAATSVSSSDIPWFIYNHDNQESAEYGKLGKINPRTYAATCYVVADLICEKFSKCEVRDRADMLIDTYKIHQIDGKYDAFRALRGTVSMPTRKLILTSSIGDREWMTKFTFESMKKLAEHNNADFLCDNTLFSEKRGPSWNKIYNIKKYLEMYDSVLWIDDDAFVKIPFLIDNSCNGTVVSIARGNCGINAGVMCWNSNSTSKILLDTIWNLYDKYKNHVDWEQPAVIEVLGRVHSPQKHILCWSEYNATPVGMRIVGKDGYETKDTKIIHFAGINKFSEKQKIENKLEQLSNEN